MHHIVYLHPNGRDLDHLLTGKKTMVARGSMSPKIPYGRIKVNDLIYFLLLKGDGIVKAVAIVKFVNFFEHLSIVDSHSLLHNTKINYC